MDPRRARGGAHARPIRRRSPSSPARRWAAADARRVLSTIASAILPGLGQLVNGRPRLAAWFAVPTIGLLALVGLAVAAHPGARLAAFAIRPETLTALLALNLAVGVWRVAAVGQAFFDRQHEGRPGSLASVGLVIALGATIGPHVVANAWGTAAQATFARVFTAGGSESPGRPVAATGPGANERINILLVGVDKTPARTATLTDSMIVVSIDPVGETASMVSIPRDLVGVPLGNGDTYAPKLNSLLSYADRHPNDFPKGGMRALEDAVGALLGIQIHYEVRVDFFGFLKLVNAVGGVDIMVPKSFYDPEYDRFGTGPIGEHGWGVDAGMHHFKGWEALAYARSRRAPGDTDFTRAARQQQVLLAVREKLLQGGSVLTNLPSLLDAFGDLLQTDLPYDRLVDLAAVAEDMSANAIVRTVFGRPLVKGRMDPVYGSVQVPDLKAIRRVAAGLFPAPGQSPTAWPSPQPSAP